MLINLQPSLGRALVVGGGPVGLRKATKLVESGFSVTVVAPAVVAGLETLPGPRIRRREFRTSDLRGHALVFACTNHRETNRRVGELARSRGLPVCVCDAPEESTFWGVASFRKGEVEVGISSDGRDPKLARRVKEGLARLFVVPPSGGKTTHN
jgi:siroheme synthase-like protein